MLPPMEQAVIMLEAFLSVGTTDFGLTFIDLDRRKAEYRPSQTLPCLKPALPYLMKRAESRQWSIAVRPRSGIFLVQLDDIKAPLPDLPFLSVETSPGNFQSWLAVRNGDEELARRMKQGADRHASGSVRLAGSRNYKPIHAPDYPVVILAGVSPGRILAREQVSHLLGPEEPRRWVDVVRDGRPTRWPDYERILAGAPLRQDKSGPDVSRANFLFCRMAAQIRWNADEVANRLMELSLKAQRAGYRYALRTAHRASLQGRSDGF